MAELSSQAVRDRSITLAHELIGLRPGQTIESGAAVDTLAEVIRTIFENPPSGLTDKQKAALHIAFGTGSAVDLGPIRDEIMAEAQARSLAIMGEAQARSDADTALGGRIDTETANRESADTTLGGRIDTEAQTRAAADVALGGMVDDEIAARQAADMTLSDDIDAKHDGVRAIAIPSPSFIDKNDLPEHVVANIRLERNTYATGTQLAVTLAGVRQVIPQNISTATELIANVPVTTALRTALEALAVGTTTTLIIEILNSSNVAILQLDLEMQVVAGEDTHARTQAASAQSWNEMVAEPTQDLRIYSAETLAEVIDGRGELDGDYFALLREIPELDSRLGLTSGSVDMVSIAIQKADDSLVEVHREAWTVLQDRRTIEFNISGAEEAGGGAPHRLPSPAGGFRNAYRFVARFFDGSTLRGTTEAATLWLEDETKYAPPLPALSEAVSANASAIAALADAAVGTVPDRSITPIKVLSDTEERQRAWRELFAAAHISAGTSLPAINTTNETDVRIIIQDVSSGISFVDLSDPGTTITSAVAGDVIMVLNLREKQWVRVGNLIRSSGSGGSGTDQTARDNAAEALSAAMSNADRLAIVEPLLRDMSREIDGPELWANALAADAQFAYTWNLTSAVAMKLGTANPSDPFDPARDIVAANFRTSGGNVLWTDARTIPADSIILVRVKKGLSPVQFRTELGGFEHILEGYTYRGTDANWDYYFGGSTAGAERQVAVQRRNQPFHTAFHGELAGRSLAQLEAEATARTDADEALADRISEIDRGFSVDPPYFVRDASASAAREFILDTHSDAVPDGATHVGAVMSGTNATSRVAIQNDHSFVFSWSATNVQNLSRRTEKTLVVELHYYDAASGGNLLGSARELLRIVDSAPAGAADVAASLATETADRIAGDTALGGRIDAEATTRNAADAALGTRIGNEESARATADTALGGRIDTEATNRESADTALGGRIDTEAAARSAEDTALGTRIDNVRQLPAYPAPGSRNGKGPIWNGDTLEWAEATGGAETSTVEDVLQTPVRQSSTAGVTSLQLPMDFGDYEYLEFGIFNDDTFDGTAFITVPVAWLVAQADSPQARVTWESEEDGNSQGLSWTPSTRTFARVAESTALSRIVYARLYTPGKGVKGEKGNPGPEGPRVAGTPPREITGVAGVYTLLPDENEIHVEVEQASDDASHANKGDRTFPMRVLRADLSSTPKHYATQGRNPTTQRGDTNNGFIGFIASISGNDVTISQGPAGAGRYVGTINKVYGIVSGAKGEKGDSGEDTTARNAAATAQSTANTARTEAAAAQTAANNARSVADSKQTATQVSAAISTGNAASVDGFSFRSITQAAYDALSSKDAATVYMITG